MGKNSKIEWTDHTWNPWYGCHKVSQGCKNCYMYRDMARTPFNPNIVTRAKPATFNKPLTWKELAMVFTCSWSDFWIEEADEWREKALQIIADTPHLTYQILTKRPERILDWLDKACWPVSGCPIDIDGLPNNVWLGVSVEDQKTAEERIPILFSIPAKVKFLSLEPLLGKIDLGVCFGYIDWIITGGESGPENKIRKADLDWFRNIRDQILRARKYDPIKTAFFHKQHGGSKKINGVWGGRVLDGRTWDEMPNI